MVGAEGAGGEPATWLEGFVAFLLLILTLGGQAWRYIRESSKEDAAPKHVVLETAELADMAPLRAIVQRLDKLLELESDIRQMHRDDSRILAVLERIDRADEIEREVRARLREEGRH